MTSDVPNTIWALGGTQTRGEHGSRFLPLQDVEDKFNKVALMSLYTLMYKILNDQSAPHLRGCPVVVVTKNAPKFAGVHLVFDY